MTKTSKLHQTRQASQKRAIAGLANKRKAKRNEKNFPQAQKLWSDIQDFIKTKSDKVFCPHLRIGSSLFNRFRQGTLTPAALHKREAYADFISERSEYEHYFIKQAKTHALKPGGAIEILDHKAQPSKMGHNIPFLSARPDFEITFRFLGNEKIHNGLVEVKSTTLDSELTKMLESETSDALWQLVCALHVFNKEHGFLVCYDISKPNFPIEHIRHVKIHDYVITDSMFADSMAKYIVKLIDCMLPRPEDECANSLMGEIRNFFYEYLTHLSMTSVDLKKKFRAFTCEFTDPPTPPNKKRGRPPATTIFPHLKGAPPKKKKKTRY